MNVAAIECHRSDDRDSADCRSRGTSQSVTLDSIDENFRLLALVSHDAAMPKSYAGPKWRSKWKFFGDYEREAGKWITTADAEYFPDYLIGANERYAKPLRLFGKLAAAATSSVALYKAIMEDADAEHRTTLTRIFRRYASPKSPVELLKRKSDVADTLKKFSADFRPIEDIRSAFASRPTPDEAIAAILWEHQERGKKGAELTKLFFSWVEDHLPDVDIRGGRDVPLDTVLSGYLKKRGVDLVMTKGKDVLAIGYLHYDSDRGGSQEADRTGGYREAAEEIATHLQATTLSTKILFINDGPGLLAGAMWSRYATLEKIRPYKILVSTLKMLPHRLTMEWLRS